MPVVTDFRTHAFDIAKINACGRDVGRNVYWRLFAVENLVRVVVHSVLTKQVAPNWWAVCVDPDTQKQVARFQAQYAAKPWHGSPGLHEIYYTFLSDLNPIIATNSHHFLPLIPDIDTWIGRIEQIRVPRNVVGHMNWPSVNDRKRIDLFHDDFQALVKKLAATSGVTLLIP